MVETVEEETEGKGPTGVELLKAASNYLRGSLAEEFADPQIFISDAAYQLMKFHGSYQQDDRDQRNERRRAGETYAFSFMVRLRLPGGDVHPELFLALDRLSDEIGNGSLRLTTRQSVQLHGIGKHDLRTVMSEVRPDWDLSAPGLREAWDKGDLSRFHGWNKPADAKAAQGDQKKG